MATAATATKPNVVRSDRDFGLATSSAGAGASPAAARGPRFPDFFGGLFRLRANVVPLGRECQKRRAEDTDRTLDALPNLVCTARTHGRLRAKDNRSDRLTGSIALGPSAVRALRSGALEICINPANGWPSSRML